MPVCCSTRAPGVRERLGVGILLDEVHHEAGERQHDIAIGVPEVGEGYPARRGGRRALKRGRGTERWREVPAVFQGLAPGDLEDLHVEDDLGLLEVVRRDHFFHELDLLRRVTDGDGIEHLVHVYLLRVEHGAEKIHDVLRLRVVEVKRLDHEVLVLVHLRLGLGDDDDGVGADLLHEELVGGEEEVKGILEGHVLHEDRNGLRLHLFVEEDIDARELRQELEDIFDIGVLEIDGNGLVRGEAQGFVQLGLGLLLLELAQGLLVLDAFGSSSTAWFQFEMASVSLPSSAKVNEAR